MTVGIGMPKSVSWNQFEGVTPNKKKKKEETPEKTKDEEEAS